MATRKVTVFTDDISGETLAPGQHETIRFSLDNATYTIDLGLANAAKLRKALAPYIAAGTRGTRQATAAAKPAKGSTEQVRAWAAENGHQVSARGRIPAVVMDAYRAAQQ